MRKQLAIAVLIASAATAGTITFTETTTASGSLGSDTFTNTLVTLTGVGDTAQVSSLGGGDYVIPVTATVNIASLGVTATIADSVEVGVCTTCPDPSVDFDKGGPTILGDDNSAFGSYFLATSIGPITSDGTSVGYGEQVNTNLGVFEFTTPGTPVFTAVTQGAASVPEPGAWMLTGAGLLACALFRRRGVAACVGAIVSAAAAQGAGVTLFSDLASGANPYYSSVSGSAYPLYGSGLYGTPEILAAQFTPSASANVGQVDIGLTYVAGYSDDAFVTIQIAADNGGQPGAILQTWTNVAVPQLDPRGQTGLACCTLTSVTTGSGPALTAGTPYWLIVTPYVQFTNLEWYSNLGSVTGTWAYGPGGGWTLVTELQQFAFDVQGATGGGIAPPATPAPASLLLVSVGFAALAIARFNWRARSR